jgi:hypothetical protein
MNEQDKLNKSKNVEKLIKRLIVPKFNAILQKYNKVDCELMDVKCGIKFRNTEEQENAELDFWDMDLSQIECIVRLYFKQMNNCEIFGLSKQINNLVINLTNYIYLGEYNILINLIDVSLDENNVDVVHSEIHKKYNNEQLFTHIDNWFDDGNLDRGEY